VTEVSQTLTVYVVDDDRDVRMMVSRMAGDAEVPQATIQPHPFASATDFLEGLPDLAPGCVVLDLRMPEVDGFAVLAALKERDIDWPVIVMTGAGDVASAVQAMKLGAVEFLEKPIRLTALETALQSAVKTLRERQAAGERRRAARERVGRLSARETEVLQGLLRGLSNKELARALGIGLRTVEMHRGNMMDRLEVSSVAQAVALAIEAGLNAPEPTAA
jgi:two-component system, LuxR family, response regulator FixJ